MGKTQNSTKDSKHSSDPKTNSGETTPKIMAEALKDQLPTSPPPKSLPSEKKANSTVWIGEAKAFIEQRIPKEYQHARIKDFSDCLDTNDIEWDKYGFCFGGNTGIGKTHLATAIAIEYLRPTHSQTIVREVMIGEEVYRYKYSTKDFVWISAPVLLARIRSSFNGGRETEYEILQEMVKAKVLVMDDLGSENSSDFSASTLYAILSERRNHRRVTIVTTNQQLSDIHDWEPRVASRLAEFSTISLPNIDRRLQGAQGSPQQPEKTPNGSGGAIDTPAVE